MTPEHDPPYESLAQVRDSVAARLTEIEHELKAYDDLVRERDMLREILALPPMRSGAETEHKRPRARRGENIQRILQLVDERKVVTAEEIADATGISKGVVYNTVRSLVERGQLEKATLETGVSAYRATAPLTSS